MVFNVDHFTIISLVLKFSWQRLLIPWFPLQLGSLMPGFALFWVKHWNSCYDDSHKIIAKPKLNQGTTIYLNSLFEFANCPPNKWICWDNEHNPPTHHHKHSPIQLNSIHTQIIIRIWLAIFFQNEMRTSTNRHNVLA